MSDVKAVETVEKPPPTTGNHRAEIAAVAVSGKIATATLKNPLLWV